VMQLYCQLTIICATVIEPFLKESLSHRMNQWRT
jgi:hypothetical protein